MNEWERTYRERRLEDIPWHSSQPEKQLVELVDKGMIKPGRVLDMGSGDGTNSLYLASRGFEVYGIDISPTAVKIARHRSRRRNLQCTYTVGDVLEIRTLRRFDLILDRGCFHHIPDEHKERYTKKISGLLKKKGHLFLKCFSDKEPHFAGKLSKEDIRKYFSKYFKIEYVRDSIHVEPDTGTKRYFYTAFMVKAGP